MCFCIVSCNLITQHSKSKSVGGCNVSLSDWLGSNPSFVECFCWTDFWVLQTPATMPQKLFLITNYIPKKYLHLKRTNLELQKQLTFSLVLNLQKLEYYKRHCCVFYWWFVQVMARSLRHYLHTVKTRIAFYRCLQKCFWTKQKLKEQLNIFAPAA